MFPCTECGTQNPLDSQFCKNCGHSLPSDGLAQARVDLDNFVSEGNTFFTEGRTEEALMVAETAMEANPAHAMAHSLKGMCQERKGLLAEALESYEKAIALNPDSSLDKIKVAALRNRLASQISEDAVPDRRRAWLAAGGAVIFIVALGFIFISHFNSTPKAPLVASNPSTATGFPPAVTPGPNAGTANNNPNSGQTNPAPNSGQPSPNNTSAQPNVNWPPLNPNGSLPLPTTDGGQIDPGQMGFKPVTPGSPPNSGSTSHTDGSTANTTSTNGGPPPALTSTDPDSKADTDKPKEIISIDVGNKQGKDNQPGSQSIEGNSGGNNGLETLRRVAANQFQLGQYSKAADTYGRLIEIGGDSATVRQRLGQIYSRLGDNARAITEYKTAIALYQSLINQGINASLNKTSMKSCEDAMKLLE